MSKKAEKLAFLENGVPLQENGVRNEAKKVWARAAKWVQTFNQLKPPKYWARTEKMILHQNYAVNPHSNTNNQEAEMYLHWLTNQTNLRKHTTTYGSVLEMNQRKLKREYHLMPSCHANQLTDPKIESLSV